MTYTWHKKNPEKGKRVGFGYWTGYEDWYIDGNSYTPEELVIAWTEMPEAPKDEEVIDYAHVDKSITWKDNESSLPEGVVLDEGLGDYLRTLHETNTPMSNISDWREDA